MNIKRAIKTAALSMTAIMMFTVPAMAHGKTIGLTWM